MWGCRVLPAATLSLMGALAFASGFLSSQALADESPTPEQQAAALANVPKDDDPSMTVQSTCFANGKDRHLVADDYFDQFFSGGEKAPTLTP